MTNVENLFLGTVLNYAEHYLGLMGSGLVFLSAAYVRRKQVLADDAGGDGPEIGLEDGPDVAADGGRTTRECAHHPRGLIAVTAYAATVVLGVKTYREAELDSGFWANFSFAAALGFLWTGVVFLEWIGIAGAIMDALGTSLLAVLIGVTAIASTGTIATVEDLKTATKTAASRRAEAEEQRETAEEQRQQAEAAKREADGHVDTVQRTAGFTHRQMIFERKPRIKMSHSTKRSTQQIHAARWSRKPNEAMTEIATAFDDMMETLSETLTTVTQFAGQVDDSTDELGASAEEVRSASRDAARRRGNRLERRQQHDPSRRSPTR